MRYTEADFQNGRIVGFFTNNLKWKEGLREEIDRERLVIPSDLYQFKVEVSISPLKEKDSVIIPFDSVEEKNEIIINEFLTKWVKEPYKILEEKEGCEINFNKVFPKQIVMRKSSDILAELAALDKEFGKI